MAYQDLTGNTLNHYRLVRILGRGGMADVYLAEDTRLNRHVALKVLPPEFARDEERSQRFDKEIRATAGLDHPHITTVYEVGEAQGLHYFTMSLLTGGELKQRIRQGMSHEECVRVLQEMASALSYAHNQGFVHRDIKPENILFHEDGRSCLTDLGIALVSGSGTRMTATGMSVGTPHYMSPEQCQGQEKLDGRSDLYSLGVVFYEMLTGKVPFDANNTVGIVMQHVQAPLPQLPAESARYQPILDGLLAKNRTERFANAGDLLKSIEIVLKAPVKEYPERKPASADKKTRVVRQTPVQAAGNPSNERKPSSGTRGVLWALAGAALATIAGLSAWYLTQPNVQPAGGAGLRAAPSPPLAVTAQPESRVIAAESPARTDSDSIAGIHIRTDPASAQIYIDGSLKGAGEVELSDMPAGKRVTVRVVAEGYETVQRQVSVPQDRILNLDISLEATSERYALTIETDPPDAEVRILNIGPRYQPGIQLAPGRYHVEVSRSGFSTQRKWVDLANSARVERIALEKVGYAFAVQASPVNANIRFIEPEMVYSQGMVLAPGRYLVEASSPGYQTLRWWVEVNDTDLDVPIQLTPTESRPREPVASTATAATSTGPVDARSINRSEKKKLSYAVGWDLGSDIARRSGDFNIESLILAIRDANRGTQPRIAEEEMKGLLESLQSTVREEQLDAFQDLAKENLRKSEQFMRRNRNKTGIIVLPSGVQYRIIEDGRGRRPSLKSTVVMHYRGSKMDGNEFDSSFARGNPEEFTVNAVLQGWQEVLPLMREGSTWQVFVPPELAFGQRGNPPVGPNEALVFEMKLLEVRR